MNYLICGSSGSGKDVVASLIQGQRIAFADDLKLVTRLLRIHDINGAQCFLEYLFGDYAPQNIRGHLLRFEGIPVEDGKDRRILQEVGTWARSIHSDIWINAVKDKVARSTTSVIITDCRYIRELQSFPDFYPIFVECPEDVRKQRLSQRDGGYSEASLTHTAESEVRLLKSLCKSTIVNDGTMDDLRRNVESVLAWVEFTRND